MLPAAAIRDKVREYLRASDQLRKWMARLVGATQG
jgi:hypothetical protein